MYGGVLPGGGTSLVVEWGFEILPGFLLLPVTLPQPRLLGHSMYGFGERMTQQNAQNKRAHS